MTFTPRSMSDLEFFLYTKIKETGEAPGETCTEKTNALTWLRRNGFIRNEGSRAHPKWVAVQSVGELGDSQFYAITNHPLMRR